MTRHWVCETYCPPGKPEPKEPSTTCLCCGRPMEDDDGALLSSCSRCGTPNGESTHEPITCDGCDGYTWEFYRFTRVKGWRDEARYLCRACAWKSPTPRLRQTMEQAETDALGKEVAAA
jgi:predicted  nucleic acid-binding Zn-ribbon protein